MKKGNLVTLGFTAVMTFICFTMMNYAGTSDGPTPEYIVMNIDAKSWIVTAKELMTGNIVKFRLPPSAFKGKTFSADLKNIRKGHPFTARNPKYARLSQPPQVIDAAHREPKSYKYKGSKNKQIPMGPPPQRLEWEILELNAATWVVKAKNSRTKETIQFKASPKGFIGFKFKANISNIRKGQGFTLITSDSHTFKNCLKLLKRSKARPFDVKERK